MLNNSGSMAIRSRGGGSMEEGSVQLSNAHDDGGVHKGHQSRGCFESRIVTIALLAGCCMLMYVIYAGPASFLGSTVASTTDLNNGDTSGAAIVDEPAPSTTEADPAIAVDATDSLNDARTDPDADSDENGTEPDDETQNDDEEDDDGGDDDGDDDDRSEQKSEHDRRLEEEAEERRLHEEIKERNRKHRERIMNEMRGNRPQESVEPTVDDEDLPEWNDEGGNDYPIPEEVEGGGPPDAEAEAMHQGMPGGHRQKKRIPKRRTDKRLGQYPEDRPFVVPEDDMKHLAPKVISCDYTDENSEIVFTSVCTPPDMSPHIERMDLMQYPPWSPRLPFFLRKDHEDIFLKSRQMLETVEKFDGLKCPKHVCPELTKVAYDPKFRLVFHSV
jgi:hypothetical protein